MHFRAIAVLAGLTAIATISYTTLWMDMNGHRESSLNSAESDNWQQQQHPIEYEYPQEHRHGQQQDGPGLIKTNKSPLGPAIHDGLPTTNTEGQEIDEEGLDGVEDDVPDNILEDEDEDKDEDEDGGVGSEQGVPAGQSSSDIKAEAGFGDRNARLAAKHINAYVQFCQQKQPKYLFDGITLASNVVNSDDNVAAAKSDNTFATYSSWIDHVHAKNSRDFSLEQHQLAHSEDPVYFERPPAGWALNLTAIHEPCNRNIHSSAHCLAFLAQNEGQYLTRTARSVEASREPMNVHIFWRGPITDKLSLSAHAFLFTQPLDRSHLHLWIDSADLPDGLPEDYTKNPYAAPLVQKPFSDYVTIHAWDQEDELRYSYPDGQEFAHDGAQAPNTDGDQPAAQVKPVALSDAARFLILNRHGGMYLDADVMLLRDMSPLFDSGLEFAYEWSNTLMYNTAILRLYTGSSVARRILDGAKAREEQIRARKNAAAQTLAVETQNQRVGVHSASKDDEDQTDFRARRRRPNRLSASLQVSTDLHRKAGKTAESGHKGVVPHHFKAGQQHPNDNRSHRQHSRLRHAAGSKGGNGSTYNKKVPLNKREEVEKREESGAGFRPNEIYHPARLRHYLSPEDSKIEGNGLIMMPTAIFDPLWLRVDRAESHTKNDHEPMLEDLLSFPTAFTDVKAVCPAQLADPSESADEAEDDDVDDQMEEHFAAGPEVFMTGAYAYHWHNSWTVPIAPESWIGRMYEAYLDFAAGRRPNLYGEWIKNL